MFRLADNKQIGAYLKKAIEGKGYPSVRQFGKACLKDRGLPTDDESLRKMANRLSQILKGSKGVQLEDLPVFTKLLDMSCEELLSAGTCFTDSANHLTNYAIAKSGDQRDWEAYLEREDQLILNADEYGMTVIDYALKFQNYSFLKFLMDWKFIWFVGEEPSAYFPSFGAGTSIENNRLFHNNLNVLDARLKARYDLRMKMITLAIKHGDLQMLTELRAREIPSLHQVSCYSNTPLECDKYFDQDLIDALADASDEILEYFSTEFEIRDRFGRMNRFLFPFISELIAVLLKRKNDYVQWVLKDAIRHNQYVLDRFAGILEASVSSAKTRYENMMDEPWINERIEREVMYYTWFYDEGKVVYHVSPMVKDGIAANLAKVEATSEDVQIRRLIQEVNELYEKIRTIKPII